MNDFASYEAIKRRHRGLCAASGETGAVEIKRGSGYQMRKIPWLWPGWLARGKLHILAGQKGAGKSTIGFDLLAQLTHRGGKFPDGTAAPLGDVLIWSGEDDIEDTILPRIVVAGGDPDRVCFIDGIVIDGAKRAFDPATDMTGLLSAALELPNLIAALIDPIVSATPGDSHKNSETRRGLQPLVDFATELDFVLLGLQHFTNATHNALPI
jgi:RecA-family ATPase